MAMVEVDVGEYKRAVGGESLVTREVYSCIVLALRIRRAGIGFLGHYYTVEHDRDDFMREISLQTAAAAEEVGDRSLVSAWLAGAALTHLGTETAAMRQDATDHVRDEGFNLVGELWLPSDEYMIPRAELVVASANFRAPFVHMDNWRD